ncbi:hypothetical protein SAMN05444349_14135 [Bacteroides faecichinchillae]|uniref:Uncharacterized protein n=1 Tax=Bacteroides faecichinchillae TaxID=871325 RepID=A0A1M5F653_9BACE|nr:hypothetical protein [Bacteroides faecichinchillae]SHF86989.1 hypothetical protein SAMN05444349_14135 [Bacteroides faecichinchillae]
MIDLKDYVPEVIQFKLPTTVNFPEVIFPDSVCMDDVKKKLAEHFVTIQEKDVIANRIMDDYEISTVRANYGEIAEEQMPELEAQLESLKSEFNAAKKEFEAKISSLHTQFKDLVNLAKKGIKDYPLNMVDTFRIPVMGYYLYYSWVNDAFRLALVQEIPKHEYNDLFNSGEKNQEAFKELGYELPKVDFRDTRKNVRVFGEGENTMEVWEEDDMDVWLEEWTEDYTDDDTGEVVPIKRHEWHRVPISDSPWRKEEDNDETSTQEGETVEVSAESEE